MRPELDDAAWLDAQFAAGRSVADVATELGCTDRAVYRAATRLGVERPQSRRTAMRQHLLGDGHGYGLNVTPAQHPVTSPDTSASPFPK